MSVYGTIIMGSTHFCSQYTIGMTVTIARGRYHNGEGNQWPPQFLFAIQSKFDWQNHGMTEEKPLLSYGPCQFPTLGLIVQRAWYAASPVQTLSPLRRLRQYQILLPLTLNAAHQRTVRPRRFACMLLHLSEGPV